MKNCNSSAAAKKPSLDSGFGAEAPATPPTATSTRANAASSSGGGISKSSSALEVQQLRTVRKGRTMVNNSRPRYHVSNRDSRCLFVATGEASVRLYYVIPEADIAIIYNLFLSPPSWKWGLILSDVGRTLCLLAQLHLTEALNMKKVSRWRVESAMNGCNVT